VVRVVLPARAVLSIRRQECLSRELVVVPVVARAARRDAVVLAAAVARADSAGAVARAARRDAVVQAVSVAKEVPIEPLQLWR
jgi:hypothetical protein